MAELYIYTQIFDFTAEFFIRSVDEAKGEDISVRLYTPGGDPTAAWGMIAKLREHEENVSLKVDGKADSAGAYFLLFFDNVEALSTSEFLFHRAHFEFNPHPSEAAQERLDNINKQLRDAMEARLNIPKFEKIAGVTLDEFFNGDSVINVNLNAKKAKSIGLIKKIINLAPEQIKALGERIAAHHKVKPVEPPKTKPKKMTLEELKADNPEIYSAIFNKGVTEGKTTGASGEKDRVQAWMAFNDVDPKAVAEGIEGDENLSQKATAEFSRKAMSVEALAKLKEENADEVTTEESPQFVAANDELKVAEESGDVQAIADARMPSLGRVLHVTDRVIWRARPVIMNRDADAELLNQLLQAVQRFGGCVDGRHNRSGDDDRHGRVAFLRLFATEGDGFLETALCREGAGQRAVSVGR